MGRHKPIILILDDKPSERASVRDLLELDGYIVVEAGTEREATRRFKERHPDLAVVDVRLKEDSDQPDLSGIRWITTLPDRFPVIVLSSYTEPDVVREALRHRKNVFTYINKLESGEVLRANIKSALLEVHPPARPSLIARLTLVVLFACGSAILCWFYSHDFFLALIAAIIVGGLVEFLRLLFD